MTFAEDVYILIFEKTYRSKVPDKKKNDLRKIHKRGLENNESGKENEKHAGKGKT